MYFKRFFCLLFPILVLFTACSNSDVKILKEDFLDTKLGTVENQKLIVSLPKVKKRTKIVSVANQPVSEKKKRFKKILIPIIISVYNDLEILYIQTQEDIKNNTNVEKIMELKKEYKAKNDNELLHALKPHPVSIVLAQAAAESAWLTSRFTVEANNIFGVWSFNKNEPRIAASGLRGDKTIYLKKYNTIEDAVRDYYKNLGKNWAYKEFRKQRTLTNNPYKLVNYLGSYSEKKEVYIELLKSMIDYNKFHKYDINYDANKEFKPKIKVKIKKVIEPKVKVVITKEIVLEKNVTVVPSIIDLNTSKVILEKIEN